MNVVILMGRLTAAPELKTSQGGTSYCRLTIAVDRGYIKPGEEKKTDFINCTAWRQTAEFVSRYFTKGQMIAVQGELQSDSYTNKDNVRINTTFVNVRIVSFCGDKSNTQSAARKPEETALTRYESGNDSDFASVSSDDDLPF